MNPNKLLRVVDSWNFLNDIAFDGELPQPAFGVWTKLYGTSNKVREPLSGGYDPAKRKLYLKHDDPHKLETLYHEMCHQWIHEMVGKEESYKHGKLFKAVYKKGLEKLIDKGVKYNASTQG